MLLYILIVLTNAYKRALKMSMISSRLALRGLVKEHASFRAFCAINASLAL